MARHRSRLADMDDDSVRALAGLLVMHPRHLSPRGEPSRAWLAGQRARAEASLPRDLLAPRPAVAAWAGFLPPPAAEEELCRAHRALDPRLARRLFALLRHEVTVRLDRVRWYHGPLKTPEVRGLQARLDRCLVLWLGRRGAAATLGRRSSGGAGAGGAAPPLRRIRSGCAACCLAAVGARAQLLVDLRAALVSRAAPAGRRRGPRPPPPRLLRLVEAWVDGFGAAAAAEMRRESDRLGRRVRRVRGADRALERRAEAARRAEGEALVRAALAGGGGGAGGGDRRAARAAAEERLAAKYGAGRTQRARMRYRLLRRGELGATPEGEGCVSPPRPRGQQRRQHQQDGTTAERPEHAGGRYEDDDDDDDDGGGGGEEVAGLPSPDAEQHGGGSDDEHDLELSIIAWYAESAADVAAERSAEPGAELGDDGDDGDDDDDDEEWADRTCPSAAGVGAPGHRPARFESLVRTDGDVGSEYLAVEEDEDEEGEEEEGGEDPPRPPTGGGGPSPLRDLVRGALAPSSAAGPPPARRGERCETPAGGGAPAGGWDGIVEGTVLPADSVSAVAARPRRGRGVRGGRVSGLLGGDE